MDYYLISALMTMGLQFVLGIFVYFKNRQGDQNRAYAILSLSVGIWAISDLVLSLRLLLDKTLYLYVVKFLQIGIIFFPSAFVKLSLAIVDESPKKYLKYFLNYFPLLLWSLTIFTPYIIRELVLEKTILYSRYLPKVGVLYNMLILFTTWSICYWIYKLIYNYKSATGLKKTQIRYFLLASVVGIPSIPIVFLNAFGIQIPPLDNFITTLAFLIVAYAIIRHRLMDIQVAFSKSLVAVLLGAGVIGFDVLFVKLLHPVIGYYFSGAIAMLIIGGVLFATPLSKRLQLGMDQLVLKGKYNYQNILREASRTVLTILNLNDLGNYIINMLRQSLGVDRVAIFCRGEVTSPLQSYKLQYGYGVEEQLQNEYEIRGRI